MFLESPDHQHGVLKSWLRETPKKGPREEGQRAKEELMAGGADEADADEADVEERESDEGGRETADGEKLVEVQMEEGQRRRKKGKTEGKREQKEGFFFFLLSNLS